MKAGALERLMSERATCCVTIIIPTDPTDRKKNMEVFSKSVQKAKALLQTQNIDGEIRSLLIQRIDDSIHHLSGQVMEGMGIFVSQAVSDVMTFPFKVKARVYIADHFETRDLHYLRQYAIPYYVVNLNKKGVQLFCGNMNELREVKDEKFPFRYEDQFEYQQASFANDSSSSLKGFEKDKTEILDIRLRAVFREADGALAKYLDVNSSTPVLVAGTQKAISLFKGVTRHSRYIVGKVSGSYHENNLDKLSALTWQEFRRTKKQELNNLTDALKEKMDGHVAEGIRDAWNAALAGKGMLLIVEKDFHHRAYMKEGVNTIYLQPPQKPYDIVDDAVDKLIEIVEAKNGKVLFTENDSMKGYGHLALQLRY